MKEERSIPICFLLGILLVLPPSSPFVIPIEEVYVGDGGQGRGSRDLITPNQTSNTNITTGVGGGFYKMKSGQVVQITSSNYGTDTYYNGEAIVWRFFGSDCGVSATCPCFKIPSSIKCFGDYLKITDIPFYDQRFCGDVQPTGIYRSASGHLRMRFRSDFAEGGQGFLCYVSCTAPGKADPQLPIPNCFTLVPAIIPGGPSGPTDQPGEIPIIFPPIIGSTPPSLRVLPSPTTVGTGTGGVRIKEKEEQKVNWVPVAGGRTDLILP